MTIYPNELSMLLMYSRYLNDIINNEFSAIDTLQLAF